METFEKVKVNGQFALKIYNADDVLVDEYIDRNLVVTGGRTALAQLIGEAAADKNVNRIAYGENGASPIISDTSITNSFEKAIEAVTYPAANSVAFAFALGLEEANGLEIREFGLLCVDDTLFARKTRAVIEKTDEIRLEGIWTITFN